MLVVSFGYLPSLKGPGASTHGEGEGVGVVTDKGREQLGEEEEQEEHKEQEEEEKIRWSVHSRSLNNIHAC